MSHRDPLAPVDDEAPIPLADDAMDDPLDDGLLEPLEPIEAEDEDDDDHEAWGLPPEDPDLLGDALPDLEVGDDDEDDPADLVVASADDPLLDDLGEEEVDGPPDLGDRVVLPLTLTVELDGLAIPAEVHTGRATSAWIDPGFSAPGRREVWVDIGGLTLHAQVDTLPGPQPRFLVGLELLRGRFALMP